MREPPVVVYDRPVGHVINRQYLRSIVVRS